jgi:hypothetical protein
MAKTSIRSITVETMRDLLQGAGFRAELIAESETMPVIRSASNGVNFEIRLFNPGKEDKGGFTDVMFMAGLPLKGPVAPEFLNRWNSIKRFGRLYVAQGLLVLALDIYVQGGVSPEYLRSQLDIWDRLLQELLTYIKMVPSAPAPKASAIPKGDAETTDAVTGDAVAANGHVGAGNSETESGISTDEPAAEKVPERKSEMASPVP